MMGMDYDMMGGGTGGTMMFFGWVLYLLIAAILILGIAALWKYLKK